MMDHNLVYLTRFEAYLLTEKRVSANTLHAYKQDCEQLLCFLKGKGILLESATLDDLKSFLHYLHENRIKARTTARKISSIKAFFRFLHAQHGFDYDIAQELFTPKIEQSLPHYLTEKEIKALLKTADEDTSDIGIRNKVMLYLMYASGIRVSELIGLKISDIQYDDCFLKVDGKGNKERMIPLNESLVTLIQEYLLLTYPKLTSIKNASVNSEYLFPVVYNKQIKPMTRQAFWGIIKQLCVTAGIKRPISPHQLRHSLATHLLSNGADLRSLQILLGHENISTVQIYTHIETSALRGTYDKKHPRSQ